ncbi:hypothetical protein [Asinibacterium sp. OR53]|uniref:hypothetical protein n=1 Tax=Asinibacterium sp. OR53 TaxID=925409 RepID=UPI0004788101|nr:hypothetical protein [Asinibacterium sp. OR53]
MRVELNHITELICLLAALWNYKYLKGTIYFYFIYYLAFVLYGELGASYFKYVLSLTLKPEDRNNMHIYLWVWAVMGAFLSYFLYTEIRNVVVRKLITVFTSLLVCYFLFLFFFFRRYVEPCYYGFVVETFYLTFLCCIYFYELFLYSEEADSIWKLPAFWVITGIFIFFTGTAISSVMHGVLKNFSIRIMGLPLYSFIAQILCVFLYGCPIVAFILIRKKQTRLSNADS